MGSSNGSGTGGNGSNGGNGKGDHDILHEHEHRPHHHHEHAHGGGTAASVPAQHKARAPQYARVWVVTCSDSRSEATYESGRWMRARQADLGHVLSGSAVIPDETDRLLEQLGHARKALAQAVLVTGGTGISRRDRTFEAVAQQIARPLPGFGELFRALSFAEIGSAAMLSRAVGGVAQDGLLLFAMPGSPQAVRLACDRLIFPELTHLLEELGR